MRIVHHSRPLAGTIAACVLLSGAQAVFATELYRWVDEQGITHFSDVPVPGAEKITVSDAQTYRAPARAVDAGAPPRSSSSIAAATYTRLAISGPTAEQVFFGGPVALSADLDPPLAPGHQLWFLLDGKRFQSGAPGGTDALIEDVPRGAHTVAAQVVDDTGAVLLTSAPVTFYLREHSGINPPRGPAITPHP